MSVLSVTMVTYPEVMKLLRNHYSEFVPPSEIVSTTPEVVPEKPVVNHTPPSSRVSPRYRSVSPMVMAPSNERQRTYASNQLPIDIESPRGGPGKADRTLVVPTDPKVVEPDKVSTVSKKVESKSDDSDKWTMERIIQLLANLFGIIFPVAGLTFNLYIWKNRHKFGVGSKELLT